MGICLYSPSYRRGNVFKDGRSLTSRNSLEILEMMDWVPIVFVTFKVLVFGTGIHHCIGHLLAKMQLSEVLWALFERFNVEVLDERVTFAPPLGQRGPAFLNVRLTERKAGARPAPQPTEASDAA